ncbi:MAG: hypothetical protein Q7U64_04105 [Desulfocapsaceae bacterium]|nr:hypothetical protein [Desulfocapsaceae bacterium]
MENDQDPFSVQVADNGLQINKVPGQAIYRMHMKLIPVTEIDKTLLQNWSHSIFCTGFFLKDFIKRKL